MKLSQVVFVIGIVVVVVIVVLIARKSQVSFWQCSLFSVDLPIASYYCQVDNVNPHIAFDKLLTR